MEKSQQVIICRALGKAPAPERISKQYNVLAIGVPSGLDHRFLEFPQYSCLEVSLHWLESSPPLPHPSFLQPTLQEPP